MIREVEVEWPAAVPALDALDGQVRVEVRAVCETRRRTACSDQNAKMSRGGECFWGSHSHQIWSTTSVPGRWSCHMSQWQTVELCAPVPEHWCLPGAGPPPLPRKHASASSRGADGMAMRAPVVVLGPAEVADVGIESAVDRQVVQRDLAEVALADEVRLLCAGAG